MNYENLLNVLKGKDYNGTYADIYNTWCHDDPTIKTIDDTIRSIWYSDGRTEIEVKEEKKNGKTEPEVCSSSQHPNDGCIYW